MINNFINSASQYLLNGMPNVSPEAKAKRLEICQSCDKFNPNGFRCNECGCFLLIKTGWATEKCPLNKWTEELPQQNNPDPLPHKRDCGCNKKNV